MMNKKSLVMFSIFLGLLVLISGFAVAECVEENKNKKECVFENHENYNISFDEKEYNIEVSGVSAYEGCTFMYLYINNHGYREIPINTTIFHDGLVLKFDDSFKKVKKVANNITTNYSFDLSYCDGCFVNGSCYSDGHKFEDGSVCFAENHCVEKEGIINHLSYPLVLKEKPGRLEVLNPSSLNRTKHIYSKKEHTSYVYSGYDKKGSYEDVGIHFTINNVDFHEKGSMKNRVYILVRRIEDRIIKEGYLYNYSCESLSDDLLVSRIMDSDYKKLGFKCKLGGENVYGEGKDSKKIIYEKCKDCEGCIFDEKCYGFGDHLNSTHFCSSEGEITKKSSENAVCNSNIQCLEDYECLNNRCKKMNIFRKLWKFFGFYN